MKDYIFIYFLTLSVIKFRIKYNTVAVNKPNAPNITGSNIYIYFILFNFHLTKGIFIRICYI